MSLSFSRGALGAAAFLVSGAFALPALAHVTLAEPQATAGSYYKAVLKVPHGCAGSPTTGLLVEIPEGIVAVKPQPKAGWKLATTKGAYSGSYKVHGSALTEGVKTISWSGGELGDDQYDEFAFLAYLAPEAGAGDRPIAIVQTCAKGETRWNEVPKAGEKSAHPAPVLKVAQAAAGAASGGHDHGAAAASFKVGALVIDAPWTRATPGGAKVGGGYLRITNTGTTPDKLVGGSLTEAGRFEVHEMAVKDGVMTMRPLTAGLEIAPGQTVELKPGGYHVMFMDLKAPLTEGQSVKGTLVFEKAGTVDVTYEVRGIGAGAGSSAPMEHKH